MAYQFVHLQAYSRKGDGKGRSTSFIFGEARRDPAASVHVENPATPVVIYGASIDEVERLHDATVDAARTTPKGGKERRVRQDQQTLMTVVASHPHTVAEARSDISKRREIEKWERLTVRWLRSLYEDKLVSVVRHEDESHWHVHAYVLPNDTAMRASALHPGQAVKAAIMADGPREGEDAKALNKRADTAYKAAMRDWQDSYYHAVGARCGLTRLGPQRRRLTRAEWQAEQVQARALKTTLDRAAEVKAKGETYIQTKKDDAARITAEAAAVRAEAQRQIEAVKAAKAAALKAQDQAVAEQRRAQDMMSRVRKEATRVQVIEPNWNTHNINGASTMIPAFIVPERIALASDLMIFGIPICNKFPDVVRKLAAAPSLKASGSGYVSPRAILATLVERSEFGGTIMNGSLHPTCDRDRQPLPQ